MKSRWCTVKEKNKCIKYKKPPINANSINELLFFVLEYRLAQTWKSTNALAETALQKKFRKIFRTLENLKWQCIDADSDLDCNAQICRDLDLALAPHPQIYKKQKKENTIQTILTKYLMKKN